MSEKHSNHCYCCVKECKVSMPPQLMITVMPPHGESGESVIVGALCVDHARLSLKEVIRRMDPDKVGIVTERSCDVCKVPRGATRDVFVGSMRVQICPACFEDKPVAAIRKVVGQ